IQIIVAGGKPDDIGDARLMPGSRAHPDHIVIAPLEVHMLQLHQMIHDDMRARSSVKNIADDMESCDDKPLYRLRDGDDKLFGAVDPDDGIKDLVIVLFLLNHPVV